MTESLWKIGDTYYRMERDLNLYKVAAPDLGLRPRRLRKVVNRIPAGTGVLQQHTAKYRVPSHLLPRPGDDLETQYQKEMGLDAHLAQTKNLIERKHGVIVPGHDETPAWLTKRGHAETLHHIHEMLDRATELGVKGFASYHDRDLDIDSPTGGKVTRRESPRPLTFTFAHAQVGKGHTIAAYDERNHHIHLNNPHPSQLAAPIDSFKQYEQLMLDINDAQTRKKYDPSKPQRRAEFAMPEGTVAHELGHAMHYIYTNATGKQWSKDIGPWASWYPAEIGKIRKRLSRYGATNPAETVAEVFARHLHGDPVTPDMQAYYDAANGHPLKVDRIPKPAWSFNNA